jgi:hypothetical protein
LFQLDQAVVVGEGVALVQLDHALVVVVVVVVVVVEQV